MNWRRVAFWLGLFALADVLLLLSPVPLPDELLTRVLPRAVVPLLALVAAGYGIKVLATARGGMPERTRTVTEDDGTGTARLVGGDIDEAFDALAATEETRWSAENAERVLRSELRRSAIMALSDRGHTREEAERLLDAGAWTDDRRAAAFLGDRHLSLRTRVRDWASGEPTRRQAEAAVEALARLTEPPGDGGRVAERPDRAPAGELFGGPLDTGGVGNAERTTDLEPEVEA
jgi:hypothetical protein